MVGNWSRKPGEPATVRGSTPPPSSTFSPLSLFCVDIFAPPCEALLVLPLRPVEQPARVIAAADVRPEPMIIRAGRKQHDPRAGAPQE